MKKLSELISRVRNQVGSNAALRVNDPNNPTLTSQAYVRAFKQCPICGQEFVAHYFSMLSAMPADEVERVQDLLNKVKQHEWEAARQARQFDRLRDAVVIDVLRCPGKRLAVVILSDPYELYHNPSVLDHEVLDDECSDRLSIILGEVDWVPIL